MVPRDIYATLMAALMMTEASFNESPPSSADESEADDDSRRRIHEAVVWLDTHAESMGAWVKRTTDKSCVS